MNETPRRFTMWCRQSHKHELLEHEQGELVAYSDYESLRAAKEAARPVGEETTYVTGRMNALRQRAEAAERERDALREDIEAMRQCLEFYASETQDGPYPARLLLASRKAGQA